MASDASPSRDEGAKKRSSKKRRDHKEAKGRSQRLIEELTESGHVALQRGNNREALDCFKKAYKASIQLEDGKVQSACSLNLGAAYVESGSPQSGLGFLALAAGTPAERGDRVADLQYNLAEAHRALGDQGRAARHFLRAAQLYRSQGDGASEGDTCMAMSRCHLRLRDMTQAAQVCVRAAESYSVSGRRDQAAASLQEAAGHMLQSDDFTNDDIVRVLTQCLQLSDAVADAESRAELYNHVGGLFSQLRCFAEAQDVYRRAVALVTSQQPARLAVVLQNLGAACNSLGEYRPALDYHREAAGIHGSLGRRGDQARCFSNLGYAHSQLGEDEQAAESFLHALQGFRDAEDYHGQLQACEGLAEAHVKLRRLDRATEFYKQALTAHAHCKDMSTSVQDHLVKKLTEAIQLQLSLSMPRALQRGPRSRRPISRSHIPPGPPDRNLRPGPRPGPSPQSQGREFNHQPHMPNGHIVTGRGVYVHNSEQGSREMPALQAESTSDREETAAAKHCGSEAAEQAACTVDQQQQPRPVEQVDGAVGSTNGESSSLAQTVEPRPSGPAAINHLFRRLKSRVCAVM